MVLYCRTGIHKRTGESGKKGRGCWKFKIAIEGETERKERHNKKFSLIVKQYFIQMRGQAQEKNTKKTVNGKELSGKYLRKHNRKGDRGRKDWSALGEC